MQSLLDGAPVLHEGDVGFVTVLEDIIHAGGNLFQFLDLRDLFQFHLSDKGHELVSKGLLKINLHPVEHLLLL